MKTAQWGLPVLIVPQALALAILLAVARPPHELFQDQKPVKKIIAPVEVELVEVKEDLPPPLPPLPGLADSLAPTATGGSEGLASLTAGVVSEGQGPGGIAVAQGEVRAEALVQESSEETRAPKLNRSSPPQYPSLAQSQGITGYVLLRVQILADGKVGEMQVLEAKPPGVFEAAAKKALRTWSYQPGIEKGKPAVMWVKHKVNFELD